MLLRCEQFPSRGSADFFCDIYCTIAALYVSLSKFEISIEYANKGKNTNFQSKVLALKCVPNYPRALYLRGGSLVQQGKTQDALDSFLECDKLAPNPPLACQIAGIYLSLSKHEEALVYMEKAYKADPYYNDGTYNIKDSYIELLMNCKKYEQALKILDEMELLKDFDKAFLYKKRASCYLFLGKHQMALNNIDKYLELVPTDEASFLLKGEILYGAQGKEAALKYLKEALVKFPQQECQILVRIGIINSLCVIK